MTEVNDISDISIINNFKIKIHEYRTSLTEVLFIDEFKRVALTYKSGLMKLLILLLLIQLLIKGYLMVL